MSKILSNERLLKRSIRAFRAICNLFIQAPYITVSNGKVDYDIDFNNRQIHISWIGIKSNKKYTRIINSDCCLNAYKKDINSICIELLLEENKDNPAENKYSKPIIISFWNLVPFPV